MRTRLLALFVGGSALLVSCRPGPWKELDSIEDLRTAFNAGRGRARLVLLLSPT
jgi:hypothetical protein